MAGGRATGTGATGAGAIVGGLGRVATEPGDGAGAGGAGAVVGGRGGEAAEPCDGTGATGAAKGGGAGGVTGCAVVDAGAARPSSAESRVSAPVLISPTRASIAMRPPTPAMMIQGRGWDARIVGSGREAGAGWPPVSEGGVMAARAATSRRSISRSISASRSRPGRRWSRRPKSPAAAWGWATGRPAAA